MSIALIGAGGHQAHDYLGALDEIANIAALVDPVGVQDLGGCDAPLFQSVEEALERCAFAAALIVTPHHLHYPLAQILLDRGIHVLCEKPLCFTSQQAEHLSTLAERRGASISVTCRRRYSESVRILRRELVRIGQPTWFEYNYSISLDEPTQGWRAHRETAGGGVLLDMGYHQFDLLQYLFGPPDSVASTLGYWYASTRNDQLEDAAAVALEYREKGYAGVLTTTRHHIRKGETLLVLGTSGAIEWSEERVVVYSRRGDVIREFGPFRDRDQAIRSMLATQLRRIADGATGDPDGQLSVMRTISEVVPSIDGSDVSRSVAQTLAGPVWMKGNTIGTRQLRA